jgi:hypothetical protein
MGTDRADPGRLAHSDRVLRLGVAVMSTHDYIANRLPLDMCVNMFMFASGYLLARHVWKRK